MSRCDRAVCEGDTRGFLEILTLGRGPILGATIVAKRAGEIAAELALAIESRMALRDLARVVHSYPTWSMIVQRLAADVAMEEAAQSRLARLALRLGRWLR
jgi:pyruvate/2-oxoglutarate dehydrogenase complex dihydrolipoamide dehydrogenase (E3) component